MFGDILYQHFLFDIPKMFDLCSIYGQENSVLLGKMISNIFTNQRCYSQDLMASIDSTYEVCVLTAITIVYSMLVQMTSVHHREWYPVIPLSQWLMKGMDKIVS